MTGPHLSSSIYNSVFLLLKNMLMSALRIRLANLHGQSTICGGCSRSGAAVLFLIKSLAPPQTWGRRRKSLLFHLAEACWTNCQTCQIKNKSIHPRRSSSQASNKREADAQFDVVHCSSQWESMFHSREDGFFLTWSVCGWINAWIGNAEESQT